MDGTIAEIRFFAGNFAPQNWAICQGQLISIAENTALFTLLGTSYGGDGQTNFALPDFRGRSPFGAGQGQGLSTMFLGEQGGHETVSLLLNNLPLHSHTLNSTLYAGSKAERPGSTSSPAAHYHSILAGSNAYSTTSDVTMAPIAAPTLGLSGGGNPIGIRPPYLGMNIIICLIGIFPSRN